MKPWNIGINKVLNIKMPFCLHWCQSATLSLILDFFFCNFLSSVCSIVVLIKFCFCSTQYYRFCYYYVPFFFKPFWCRFSFDECVVHSVMHVQFFVFFFGRFCQFSWHSQRHRRTPWQTVSLFSFFFSLNLYGFMVVVVVFFFFLIKNFWVFVSVEFNNWKLFWFFFL